VSASESPEQPTSGPLQPMDREQQNPVSPMGGKQLALGLASGILGMMGIALTAVAVVDEFRVKHPVKPVEVVATLAVGALLALAGLLVIAYTNNATSRRALEVEVANKQAQMAQAEAKPLTAHAEAKAEEERRKRVEAELQLEKLRCEKSASALDRE
jgi:hypothetical protein